MTLDQIIAQLDAEETKLTAIGRNFMGVDCTYIRTLIEAVKVMNRWSHDCMDSCDFNDMMAELSRIEAKHGA